MAGEDDLPPLPWATSRDARRAARAERRRERHEEREARHEARTQRPQIDARVIAEAAIRILDTEGLEALTIRRLAAELGTGVMTLYWYVQNKDEVLDLVADRVTAEVEIPPADGPWQERVRAMATSLRTVLLRHPAAVPIVDQRPTLGPNALRLMEAALGVLRDAGFGGQDAADGYFTLTSYVTGFAAWQVANVRVANRAELSRRDFGAMARDYMAGLPAERYPNLIALAPRLFGGSLDERFAFGIDTLVEGLTRRLAAATPAAS